MRHSDQDDQVYSVQAAALTGLDLRVRRDSRKWKPECTEALRTLVAGDDDLQKFQRRQVELMSASAIHAEAFPVPVFPEGVDVHWETENRMVWNEQQNTREERELVYEVSWIRELGVWRRFLCSQQKVKS